MAEAEDAHLVGGALAMFVRGHTIEPAHAGDLHVARRALHEPCRSRDQRVVAPVRSRMTPPGSWRGSALGFGGRSKGGDALAPGRLGHVIGGKAPVELEHGHPMDERPGRAGTFRAADRLHQRGGSPGLQTFGQLVAGSGLWVISR